MASDPAHGEQAARCRQSRCCVCMAYGQREPARVVGHHEPPIGHVSNRGRPRAELDRDTIPLCEWHHRERHDAGGPEFWLRRYPRVEWRAVRIAMRGHGAIWDEWQHVPF